MDVSRSFHYSLLFCHFAHRGPLKSMIDLGMPSILPEQVVDELAHMHCIHLKNVHKGL
jgi:hypothetical protein